MRKKSYPEMFEEGMTHLLKVVELLSRYIPEGLKEEVFKEVNFENQFDLMKKKKKTVADTPDAKLGYIVGKENGVMAVILALLLPKKELKNVATKKGVEKI